MKYTYSGSVCSDLDLVKGYIDGLLEELEPIIKDENILFEIRLILNELIINGVFHGNQCIESKCVKIEIKIEDSIMTIKVTDEGSGIEVDLLDEYDPMKMKCSGRGLIIVEGLSDELIIDDNSIVAIKCI